MANEIYSKEVALEVDMGYPANPNWKLAICTISKGFNKSVGTVTLNNDCSGDFVRELPTDASWNMSIEGNISSEPTENELSSNELQVLQDEKAIKPFRLRSLDGSYYREGMAFINQLDETGTAGEYLTFSLGLRGTERSMYEQETMFEVAAVNPSTFDTIGDLVTFNVTVTNISKRTLTNINVRASIAGVAIGGVNQVIPTLAPDAFVNLNFPYTTVAAASFTASISAFFIGGGYAVSISRAVTYTP